MDNSDEFSDVNFNEDEDDEHSASAGESESIEHTDHNICDDNIENSDSVVIDGRFVRINTMPENDIEGLDFGSEKEAYDFFCKVCKMHRFCCQERFCEQKC
ncbi:hypothetical protein P8452_56952 [Trifolium repens]|nr:hypothetical protein P8452_56952 [Trifolium repens]